MAGKPGARVIAAMLAVLDEEIPPHAAALRYNLSPSTIYDSILYREWKEAQTKTAKKVFRIELLTMQRAATQRKTSTRKRK